LSKGQKKNRYSRSKFQSRKINIVERQTTNNDLIWLASIGLAAGAIVLLANETFDAAEVDYNAVRAAIEHLLENQSYDDGSYGPLFVRLAWHASGTYDKSSKTGGSKHGTIRYSPGEADHGANAGLGVARSLLDPLVARFPGLSYADLYTLAGVVAIESMGGPKISWTPGRKDGQPKDCTPDGRLPDAKQGEDHIRSVFYRMGFNDREIVALIGAHALGRCHTDRSGFEGPWTASPTVFSNDFYVQLLERTWTPRNWDGPFQYQDESGQLMMLPTDIALIKDAQFAVFVKEYAKDEDVFFADFAAAFGKLISLGV